jgi:hypothetical protein
MGSTQAVSNSSGVLLGLNIRLNLIAPWIMDALMSQAEVAIFRSMDVLIGRIEDVVDVVGHCDG